MKGEISNLYSERHDIQNYPVEYLHHWQETESNKQSHGASNLGDKVKPKVEHGLKKAMTGKGNVQLTKSFLPISCS